MAGCDVIVDSDLDLSRAVEGTAAPRKVLDSLCLIDVFYCGFDGHRHKGQIVVHRDLAAELQGLFALMEQQKFPVAGVVPIVRFGWSDEASMAADNSSAFNYRLIAGTDRLSRHALGRAVDINPLENPAIHPDGRIAPAGAVRRPEKPGTFTKDHPVVQAFRDKGWRWGGDFTHIRDYHHFEKAYSAWPVLQQGPVNFRAMFARRSCRPTPTPSKPVPSPAWLPGSGGTEERGCRRRRRRSF
jgi:peptidoglycan LD-endopeptidase CwlK